MRLLSAAGTAGVLLMAWAGAGCSDDGNECGDGTVDCGSAVEVRWSPGELEEPVQIRLCLDGACNEGTPPYTNPNGIALGGAYLPNCRTAGPGSA